MGRQKSIASNKKVLPGIPSDTIFLAIPCIKIRTKNVPSTYSFPFQLPLESEHMKEKRRLERFDLEIPATIQLMAQGQEKGLRNLLTSNIYSGGAYFHTTKPLPEGSRVKVDLDLPLDRLERLKEGYRQAYIKVTGEVLRSESEGMAICFDEDYQIMGAAE